MKVYILHSQKDKDDVLKLATRLRDHNIATYSGERFFESADEWIEQVTADITKADAVLVCLSSVSVGSKRLHREISIALEQEKLLIPLMFEECSDQLHKFDATRKLLNKKIFRLQNDDAHVVFQQVVKRIRQPKSWLTRLWQHEYVQKIRKGLEEGFVPIPGSKPHSYNPPQSPRNDIRVDVTIPLEQAALGCEEMVHFDSAKTCETCRGKGFIAKLTCQTCKGSGRVSYSRALKVDIPGGVIDGTMIRIAGEGYPGTDAKQRGNLYIVVHVAPHQYFTQDGSDILLDWHITPEQQQQGGTITVPTLDGKEKVLIPSGLADGTAIVLNDRGSYILNRDGSHRGRGKQVITLYVSGENRL